MTNHNTPDIPIAMPVAHIAGTVANYGAYYYAGGCIFQATHYFDSAYANGPKCKGIRLTRAAGAPQANGPLYDLYAFTTGFLSYQDGFKLVLRLPRELRNANVAMYNTGVIYTRLEPPGPQLRNVVYDFETDPGDNVRTHIRNLLNNATHLMRQRSRLPNPNGNGTLTLAQYLQANPGNVETVLQDFMNGEIELFVVAGDVIGNFAANMFELRFYDSCGSTNPVVDNQVTHTYAPTPLGRTISPSYFLYLVRHATNADRVTMQTPFAVSPTNRTEIHPLEYLLSDDVLTAAGANLDLTLDVTADVPPKPLLNTLSVRNAAGTEIAGQGIAIHTLGSMWHQSRNAVFPYNTRAPVEWRYYGGMSGETIAADFGKFRTRVRAGRENLLPAPAPFDHNWVPTQDIITRVQNYWQRHGVLYNAVAEAFQVPCELLVVISCQETGAWYNATLTNSREMNVIRMEPLRASTTVEQITTDANDRILLHNYRTITGGYAGPGANAYIPLPWNANTPVVSTNTLTWGQLRYLIQRYYTHVSVSPGMMQSLVSTANEDLNWLKSMYGEACVSDLRATVDGVVLSADNPTTAAEAPFQLDVLFSDWFGTTVDAAGNTTVVAANVHQGLSRMKRAFHNIVAGAAHIKRSYNRPSRTHNRITDFDLPTVTCAYNDGGSALAPATAGSTDNDKWHRLFALNYHNANYTRYAPLHLNALIDYFNGTPDPQPAVRFWVEGR